MQDRLSIVASKQNELVPEPCPDPPDRAVGCAGSGAAASQGLQVGLFGKLSLNIFTNSFIFTHMDPTLAFREFTKPMNQN